MFDLIKHINWIDIFVVIIIIRICYISIEKGLPTEFFKFLGTLSALYFSMHYYILLSGFFQHFLPSDIKVTDFLNFFSFLILMLLGYSIFLILRKIFSKIMKTETVPVFNKWAGLVLGLLRGFLLCSIIIFMLSASGVNYLKRSVSVSASGRRIFEIAPSAYDIMWYGIFSKFISTEKSNQAIPEVRKGLDK